MQFFVLLNDHQNITHSEFNLLLNEQSTLNQLEEKISSRFNIERAYLQLYYADGEKIFGFDLNSELAQIKLHHLDYLIAKHALLDHWVTFSKSLELAQDAKSSRMMVESEIDVASMQLKLLAKTNFFITYPKLDESRRIFNNQFSYYLDTEFRYIEVASKHYFSIVHNENPACPILDIKCVKIRRHGMQRGLECHIYRDGEVWKIYHVKVHTHLAEFHNNNSCDLREIFVYKLLEIINVGPKVHFYPNVHYSGFGLYIATEEITGFCQQSEIDEKDLTRRTQLELLSRCLFLSGLRKNYEIYGADDQGKLKFVDFKIRDHCIKSEINARKYFSMEKEFRVDVGKIAFSSWDLLKNIDLANTAIDDQKKLLKKHSIEDRVLDDYLIYIKNNVNAFAHYFQ